MKDVHGQAEARVMRAIDAHIISSSSVSMRSSGSGAVSVDELRSAKRVMLRAIMDNPHLPGEILELVLRDVVPKDAALSEVRSLEQEPPLVCEK